MSNSDRTIFEMDEELLETRERETDIVAVGRLEMEKSEDDEVKNDDESKSNEEPIQLEHSISLLATSLPIQIPTLECNNGVITTMPMSAMNPLSETMSGAITLSNTNANSNTLPHRSMTKMTDS